MIGIGTTEPQFILKTKPPINTILLGLIMVLLIVESISNVMWIIYLPLIFAIFYVHFCRYCCMVSITNDAFNVRYITFWNKNIAVKQTDILKIEYEKGYYDLFASKKIGGVFNFPQYCYDRIIIDIKDSKLMVININTLAFDFDKILSWAVKKKFLDDL